MIKNYIGYLLAAHPKNPQDDLYKGVLLVISHDEFRAIALQINNPVVNMDLGSVSLNLGIPYAGSDPLYLGGNSYQSKIHVVHSTDWTGTGTFEVAPNIGITNDVSILMALSQGEGPANFRACTGFYVWENGRLEEQLDPKTNSRYRWEPVPATTDIVFESDGPDQWSSVLEASAHHQVGYWF